MGGVHPSTGRGWIIPCPSPEEHSRDISVLFFSEPLI